MEFYAVIPTYKRPEMLRRLVGQLNKQGVPRDNILVIDNAAHIVMPIEAENQRLWTSLHSLVVPDTNADPHIYRMWNRGLIWAKGVSVPGEPYAVAILNDDISLPPNFVQRMTETLAFSGYTIAFPNQHGFTHDLRNRVPGATPLSHRMTGYCFVVNGQHGIRLDYNFKWWYGDDDLCWRARADYNGTYMVQDVTVKHFHPSESTNADPRLSSQATVDRELFISKHGRAPH